MQTVRPGPPQVKQRTGCAPVQLASPSPGICGGLSQVIHAHPVVSNPAADTKVTLNIYSGQKSSPLEADLSETVDQIKKRIMQERKFGDSGSVCLLYGNRELQGPKTLLQENVKNLATLLIFHKCHGG